ncbi:hypothetical protein PIB30_043728 [Stylosanthes scabra]|uniref:Uncharacterized protein n=1 Tax=Stylosanthes scabra TaxID=79078 RepID=A0ABU6VEZ5_9FABA|nr:hypothetical protein [Stylosanthes scabra]
MRRERNANVVNERRILFKWKPPDDELIYIALACKRTSSGMCVLRMILDIYEIDRECRYGRDVRIKVCVDDECEDLRRKER